MTVIVPVLSIPPNPATTRTYSREETHTPFDDGEGSGKKMLDQNYIKALNRVAQLEKSIEFMKSQHQDTLQCLQDEITRLQTTCAGKYYSKM